MSLAESLYNYAVLLELPDPKEFERDALELIKDLAERYSGTHDPD